MKKALFTIIIALCWGLSALARTNPYLLTREDFVHASPDKQEEIIIRLMEFMVELESKHPIERKLTTSTDRYQIYLDLMKKISSAVMSEAYAQNTTPSNKEFAELANNFQKLLFNQNVINGKSQACVYGGWISKINPSTGRCRHPVDSGDSNIKNAYYQKYGKKCASSGSAEMACNPLIFGYDDVNAKGGPQPLCVKSGGMDQPANVSYDCMRKSLAMEQILKKQENKDPLNNTDHALLAAAQARMDYLKNQMADASNAQSFQIIHNTIFDTCVCSETDIVDGKYKSISINNDYKDKIKKHRTCFGMMNSLREMHQACSPDANPIPALRDFYEQWTKQSFNKEGKYSEFYTGKLAPSREEEGTEFGTRYGEIVKSPAIQQYCKDLNAQLVCEANCKINDPKIKNWLCTVNSLKRGETSFIDLISDKEKNQIFKTKESASAMKVRGATCKTTFEDLKEEDKWSCKGECEPSKNPDEWICAITEAKFNDKDVPKEELEKLYKKEVQAGSVEMILQYQGKPRTCALKLKSATTGECSLAFGTYDTEKKTIKVSASLKDKEMINLELKWDNQGSIDPKNTNDITLNWDGAQELKVTGKGTAKDKNGNQVQVSCEGVQPAIPKSEESPTCAVKIGDKIKEGDGEGKYEVTLSYPEGMKPTSIKWTATTYPTALEEYKRYFIAWEGKEELNLDAEMEFDGKPIKINCEAAKKDKLSDAGGSSSIEIKASDTTSTTVVLVVVKVMIDGKEVEPEKVSSEGYTIKWYRQSDAGLTFDPYTPKEEPKEKVKEQDQETTFASDTKKDDNKEKKPDPKPSSSSASDPSLAGVGETFTARIKEKEYGIVAKLVGKKEATSNEVKIPKMRIVTPVGPMNQMQRIIVPESGNPFTREFR